MEKSRIGIVISTIREGRFGDKPARWILDAKRAIRRGESAMNNELLAMVEREVLGWPGVWKKRDENGPGGVGVTGYRFGKLRIGHVHDDCHADFSFPREVRDELIRSGQAIAHPAFPNSRTTASYRIRSTEDVPKSLKLFRMNYERLKEATERKAKRRKERNGPTTKVGSGEW